MFFSLASWQLALFILAVITLATLAGYLSGRYLRKHQETLREPFGVLQAALLGIVGLILAFGSLSHSDGTRTAVQRAWTRRTRSALHTSAPN